ncbi:hypothetical protein SAY86_031171 [Trapa natans]|uniref:Protein kinase domain-containing protein n=1 Tax=Trapa natans TaxID=22666 RepID=A0AAN7RE60_TRANT|nr:hypothetical protein SAY86_031171 [Trapa natans]
MTRKDSCLHMRLFMISIVLSTKTSAVTDLLDAIALQDLYVSLNYPFQLKGWRSKGGDPCGGLWTGVICSGSSVAYIKLDGLNLTGILGTELHSMHNLKHLDLSSNGIHGKIPQKLPPNATLINLACNQLVDSIPYTIGSLKHLRHLNLSHNNLSGAIGNVFSALQNLKKMDLSYNGFAGDLPSSFSSLTNLTELYLQNNNFTGAVILLASLPLTDLNIQENNFSGIIPKGFEKIPNLWFDGNNFDAVGSPPWLHPLSMPVQRNISSPPTSQSSAIENHPFPKVHRPKKKKVGPGGIACIVGGGMLAVSCAALLVAIFARQARAVKPKRLRSRSYIESRLNRTMRGQASPAALLPVRSPAISTNSMVYTRRSFCRESKFPARAKIFTVEQLQSATNGFSEERNIGEGSLGSVYKAYLPDGRVGKLILFTHCKLSSSYLKETNCLIAVTCFCQILAVKVIKMVSLSFEEEEQVLGVILTVSKLRHPNVVTLLGYCIEHGQHILVYEYVRNLSLEDALHSGIYRPLPWNIRLKIALGVAQALEYMHLEASPPVAHNNIKAGNILLDGELSPRVCDCGLAVLRPFTSNSVKLKASEMAIRDSGYIAPEDGQPGIEKIKSDIYAFGVLLLELLTGRRPLDISTPRQENSLVRWASCRLHDLQYLEMMVDHGIRGTISSRSLSRLADIISRCLQPDYEFRPPMSDVVESLLCLQERFSLPEDRNDCEIQDKSFRSTHTRFFGSPTSHFSSEI